MMKLPIKIALLIPFIFCLVQSKGQNAIFLQQGKIQYARKINTYAILNEQLKMARGNAWTKGSIEFYKKNNPQFDIDLFNLVFDKDTSCYTPIKTDEDAFGDSYFVLNQNTAKHNIVYSNLKTHQAISAKEIVNELFLIKDSTRKIQWKITDETRTIAGFECRRANALIMDSIYVVAFYTNEILTTGGPESFNGLPGMILEVALPHRHISWKATKVLTGAPTKALTPPTKGKQMNNKELLDKLNETLSDWGNNGKSILVNAML